MPRVEPPPYIPFKVVAHRGRGGKYPGNTLKAIEEAIRLGVDFVEVDVRRSKDGELVLWHDDTLEKLIKKPLDVSEEDYSYLKKFDVGMGEHIPLFEDALDLMKGKVGVLVDVKKAGYEKEIYEALKERDMLGDTIFSGDNQALARLKEIDPNVAIAYTLYAADPRSLFQAKRLGALFVNFKFPTVTLDIVTRAHEMGLGVIVWVVNAPEALVKYARLQVDVITTDTPQEALRLRERLKEQSLAAGTARALRQPKSWLQPRRRRPGSGLGAVA